MKPRISEDTKISLTLKQLKALVRESIEDSEGLPPNSPIDGLRKTAAKNKVYRIIGNHGGMYRDEDWGHVHDIFAKMKDAGLNVSYGTVNDWRHSGGYYRNDAGRVAGKQWEFSIDYVNERGRRAELTGQVIAAFGGTVKQMEEDDISGERPYDICVVFTC